MATDKTPSGATYATALQRIEACRVSGKTTLDLRGLGLEKLPPEIGKLTDLTRLTLWGNQLSSLPPEIGQMAALTELDLRRNQLSSLPPEISHLSALATLDLDNNQLTSLPPEIVQLTALSRLHLSGNQLSSLPPEISHLSALSTLDLNNNQLTSLPPEIVQLTALSKLHLSGNELSSLPPEISHLSALSTLDLDNNQLSSLAPEIIQLTALSTLGLCCNRLRSLPPEILKLTALSTLNLCGNQLTSLPPEIGQLSRLIELDVRDNRLTALPDGLASASALKSMMVAGNPLPAELLKLSGGKYGKGTKLLKYLRARAGDVVNAVTAPESGIFNEAKLLLVGPGNVGKTWLLQALLGRIPQQVDSTKGIEIARLPLDVPHPTDLDRVMHLTCWDFGGQEHFQVTHQIFFSAKAVYLLVWKPREGFDPEMEARLERIQLSAGNSAKVLIVSTHADGTVPAVIGKDALRQRFGDLIWGFYEVDSANGSTGTGIAALRQEIANAVAQLEGMDLRYPASWHAAQRAIRQIGEPAVPFQQIIQVCEQHGLDADTADTLSQLLEVQGHAVYFPEAATDADAGSLAEENIVVLDPEWLAKAVGFVMEDRQTIARQGILQHRRLAEIWKPDTTRGCPGYQPELHGYLLWLMWKFDIAYRQDEATSLVPELIARNRPDDLLWTPLSDAQSRELRAICVMTSEETKKQIAFPKGLMPALTAAIHPLRQRRLEYDGDQLDRNWNNGFFLNTQHRGAAFVELLDRELHLVVRHTYPRSLLELVQKTIETLVPQRWKHAIPELRVPCPGKVKDKPCPGMFRKSWLDKLRPDGMVDCQQCERTDVKVADLLEGFNPRDQEIMDKLRDLKDGQQDLMSAAYGIFRAMDPENMERRRGPGLFTILPEQGGWASNKCRITCWCEHPDGPHPGSPIGSNEAPDYVVTFPKGWLVKISPYISSVVGLIKAFTPLAGNVANQIVAAALGGDLKFVTDTMKDIAIALPGGRLELDGSARFDTRDGRKVHEDYDLVYRPQLVALGRIHDLLEEQIPSQQRWGTLRPVQTKTGDILWLCAEHAAIQSPPPPQRW